MIAVYSLSSPIALTWSYPPHPLRYGWMKCYCSVGDTTLLSCYYRGIGVHNCDHSDDVALECAGMLVVLIANFHLHVYLKMRWAP